jgi:hypothetical protein
MTDFYTRMQTTANRLLKDKGQSLTISRQTAGAYDPATGQTTVTVTTQTGTGAIFDYRDENVDGVLILSGDKQLLLSAVNTTGTALTAPEVNDTVTDAGSVVRTITRIKTLAPAGTVVMYDINLRGAA